MFDFVNLTLCSCGGNVGSILSFYLWSRIMIAENNDASIEWLSRAAIARYFGVSRQLAAHWDKRGWLPPATIFPDGRRSWNSDELGRFLASPGLAAPIRRRISNTGTLAHRGAQK
jgi:hypothetical protein